MSELAPLLVAVVIVLMACYVASAVLVAATPWLMPRREAFAVTVPPAAHDHPRIVRLRRRYAVSVGALALVGLTTQVAALAAGGVEAFMGAMIAATSVLMGASFAGMLACRVRVRALKEELGWVADAQRRAAAVGEPDLPRPLGLAWELAHLLVIAATALLMVVLWPQVPDLVPMHANAAGEVDGWSAKGAGTFLFPMLVQAFVAGAMVVSHAMMLCSRRPADPDAPADSALSYARFLRAMSIALVAGGLALNVAMASFALSAAQVITLAQAVIVVMVGVAPIVVGTLAVAVRYGQAGALSMSWPGGAPSLKLSDDADAHWKLGVIYVNPADAALVVPERFGVGWTLNLGRPLAWVAIGGFVVFTAAFVVLIALI